MSRPSSTNAPERRLTTGRSRVRLLLVRQSLATSSEKSRVRRPDSQGEEGAQRCPRVPGCGLERPTIALLAVLDSGGGTARRLPGALAEDMGMDDESDSPSDAEADQRAQKAGVSDSIAEREAESDGEGPSTALVELLPGVAVVFGKVPDALKLNLVDFGLVPAVDRNQLTTTLGSIVGNTTTIGGNLANAMSSAQGLYRVSSSTQALLSNGGVLAVKDGANLGSVWMNGELVAQARFIPVSAVSAASALAAIGPAVAMVALQMQLNEISGLVRTNIALATQVLGTVRNEQWAELTGHVDAIDRALLQAREVESIPSSLWDTISGDEAALRKQVDLYRRHIAGHLRKIDQQDLRARREYLDANAEAIVFDAHALISSLKAWTGYKALQAGRARTAADDPTEALLVDVIVRDTRNELEPALAEATRLVDAVTRELSLSAELTGPTTTPLTRRRKDREAARITSAELLKAIEPLADALRPPPMTVGVPPVGCSLMDLDLDPYLRVLRWVLDQDETLRGIGFCHERDDADLVHAVGRRTMGRINPEQWATLIVITDRHVITSQAGTFRREGRVGLRIPLDEVRYVRARTSRGGGRRAELDIATRTLGLKWGFHPDTDEVQVDALAALLAESMRLPDAEREALIQRPRVQISAAAGGDLAKSGANTLAEPSGS